MNYSGAWTHESFWVRAYNNTDSYSNQPGATVDCWVYGSTFSYMYTMVFNRGIAHFRLTDIYGNTVDEQYLDLYNPNIYWQRWYSKIGLPRGWYHVIVSVTGNRNPASQGTYVDIDGILVNN